MPVAWRRSISAQSGGAEHVIIVAVSFSTQRNAGMSSFEPSRIPAWLAPVCDEKSVSHSASRCVSSWSQRAISGALPSRSARRSTGQREPVDLEEDDPRDVGAHLLALPLRDPLDDPEREGVVVVRAEDHLEHDRDRGRDQRGERAPSRTSRP